MNYLGQGKLIGYKTYTKDNVQKHVYGIINGMLDTKTGLYSECEYITIVQTEQTLKDIRVQDVAFEVSSGTYAGKTKNRYINLRPLKEQ